MFSFIFKILSKNRCAKITDAGVGFVYKSLRKMGELKSLHINLSE